MPDPTKRVALKELHFFLHCMQRFKTLPVGLFLLWQNAQLHGWSLNWRGEDCAKEPPAANPVAKGVIVEWFLWEDVDEDIDRLEEVLEGASGRESIRAVEPIW